MGALGFDDLGFKYHTLLLLMAGILHHLGWLKPINNGIIIILRGAGFQPSTVGGGFTCFLFSPLLGEMIQFDEHVFQMG